MNGECRVAEGWGVHLPRTLPGAQNGLGQGRRASSQPSPLPP